MDQLILGCTLILVLSPEVIHTQAMDIGLQLSRSSLCTSIKKIFRFTLPLSLLVFSSLEFPHDVFLGQHDPGHHPLVVVTRHWGTLVFWHCVKCTGAMLMSHYSSWKHLEVSSPRRGRTKGV